MVTWCAGGEHHRPVKQVSDRNNLLQREALYDLSRVDCAAWGHGVHAVPPGFILRKEPSDTT